MTDEWSTELSALKTELVERVRDMSRPAKPLSTDTSCCLFPRLTVDVVLFDVYGTLFMSEAGDIEAEPGDAQQRAFSRAAGEVGLCFAGEAETAAEQALSAYYRDLGEARVAASQEGVDHPEPDVRDVWYHALCRLARDGMLETPPSRRDVLRLITVLECLDNPVWPMPGLAGMLAGLRRSGHILGIVSNAQFYTPLLFPALMKAEPGELGFDPELCSYSFRHGVKKPSAQLYLPVLDTVQRKYGVAPGSVLMVGNDRLKDIAPAADAGCRTALFAGDRRSLRLRSGESACRGREPDLVLTDLAQLPAAVT